MTRPRRHKDDPKGYRVVLTDCAKGGSCAQCDPPAEARCQQVPCFAEARCQQVPCFAEDRPDGLDIHYRKIKPRKPK